VRLVDGLALNRGADAVDEILAGAAGSIILYDTLTQQHLATIGESIWQVHQQSGKPLFVAGSSGIESALVAHWKASGILPSESKGFAPPRAVDCAIKISGSCSPVTARQIEWAAAHGCADVSLDTIRLLRAASREVETESIALRVVAELDTGRSVVVHTCRGPEDARIAETKQTLATALSADGLGVILGRILGRVLELRRVGRIAVAGGDTSGAIARTLGIDALEMTGPLAPGAPLCVAHSRSAAVDGVEFTFKGGQVGHDDFFGALLRGGPNR
jgi:uncharacterized protein YgbK (DUF1537 family)